jgi:hypothetical protein
MRHPQGPAIKQPNVSPLKTGRDRHWLILEFCCVTRRPAPLSAGSGRITTPSSLYSRQASCPLSSSPPRHQVSRQYSKMQLCDLRFPAIKKSKSMCKQSNSQLGYRYIIATMKKSPDPIHGRNQGSEEVKRRETKAAIQFSRTKKLSKNQKARWLPGGLTREA